MEKMSVDHAARLIQTSNGKVLSVTFYKKGKKNGEEKNDLRTMRCMLGENTRKGLAGGDSAYNPKDHRLVWVYLMAGDENRTDEKNRRSISIDGIVRLAIDGHVYEVDGRPW